ncbi:hypothetical protein C8Q78DRAFT_1083223 [Trametes maxima]|nr:hypothetical protein C8Q78DRAFT_1083223 [Trametes maxima]
MTASATDEPEHTAAAQLKAEGNTRFRAKDYTGAYTKFTEAIRHCSSSSSALNAVLHCNRSACSLALGRFLDAYADANRATELDPGYAKAWARRAAAQAGSPTATPNVIYSLERALACLPEGDTSPAVQKQRAEYAALLASVPQAQRKLEEECAVRARPWQERLALADPARLPWKLAAAALPQLRQDGRWNSSAWLISYARSKFERGFELMKDLKVTPSSSGPNSYSELYEHAQTGAVEHLTNALLVDRRAMNYIDDPAFMTLLAPQMRFERVHFKGWANGGSQTVIEEATRRYEEGGLTAVRDALDITVRCWILQGWFDETFIGSMDHTLDYYTCALEVLQWGIRHWEDEEIEARGLIFQDAMIRAVKLLRLRALSRAYVSQPDRKPTQLLEEMRAGSDELLKVLFEERRTPLNEAENALFLGFVRYQLAEALSLGAFCSHHLGMQARVAYGMNHRTVVDAYTTAAVGYLRAADVYPLDDEHHLWALHCAWNILYDVGRPAGQLIDILDRMHDTLPRMNDIWDVALETGMREREAAFDKDMQQRASFVEDLANGRLTRGQSIMRGPSGPG